MALKANRQKNAQSHQIELQRHPVYRNGQPPLPFDRGNKPEPQPPF